MSTSQIKALEDYFRLIDRNATAHAIRAAVDLGVLAALEDGQKTLEQLASSLSLNENSLRLLLNVLCRTELIEKYGDDYALSTVARLIPGKFHHLGDHYWQFLSGFVRTGVPLPSDHEVPVTDDDFGLNQASREWTQTPAAMDAASVLEVGTARTNLQILEIGCGAAVFGVAIAHHDPGSRLTLVDHPSDLPRAITTVKGVGLEDRVSYVEADYLDPEWVSGLEEEDFDLIIVAGVVHRHSPEECQRLFSNIARLCRPSTQLAVIDAFAGQEKGDVHREIFELEVSLRTSKGQIYLPAEIEQQLKELGFDDIQYAHLPSAPYIWGLILGTRPS